MYLQSLKLLEQSVLDYPLHKDMHNMILDLNLSTW